MSEDYSIFVYVKLTKEKTFIINHDEKGNQIQSCLPGHVAVFR